MVDPFSGSLSATFDVEDARQIARELVEREVLPAGFDLAEFVGGIGGDIVFDAREGALEIDRDGTFTIAVPEARGPRGREAAAELLGMYMFISLSTEESERRLTLPWSRKSTSAQQLAATFAREILVPGKRLDNLVAFYGLGRDGAWRRAQLEFLAGVFAVERPCMEVRLAELGLIGAPTPAGTRQRGARR